MSMWTIKSARKNEEMVRIVQHPGCFHALVRMARIFCLQMAAFLIKCVGSLTASDFPKNYSVDNNSICVLR